jgi:GTP-binding protein YchF
MGIVGLPNVGKSTIFNALTGGAAAVANYPFTTIDANVGVVDVPDPRLEALARITAPEKLTPATIEFIDIAGLVRGASKGEGLGNQFLAKVREVDAICHVLRGFEHPDVAHVTGKLAPLEDMEIVDTEFRLADLEVIEKRIEKTARKVKLGEKDEAGDLHVLESIRDAVSKGKSLTGLVPDERGRKVLGDLFLLSTKPVLFVLNVDEVDAAEPGASPWYRQVEEKVRAFGARMVAVSGKIEAELSALPAEERLSFARDLGLEESALAKLIRESRGLLNLITFYTIKGTETRAWNIRKGTKAAEAAGKIHSDMEKGFIRAEVVNADELLRCGSMARAREEGKVLVEGRDYTVRDGEVLLIKFKT